VEFDVEQYEHPEFLRHFAATKLSEHIHERVALLQRLRESRTDEQLQAGGPPFWFAHHLCRGCPVLAFFARAGSDAADTTFVRMHKPIAYAFVVPALCKLRKGRGTLRLVFTSEIKSPGDAPARFKVTNSHPCCDIQPCASPRNRSMMIPNHDALPHHRPAANSFRRSILRANSFLARF
jgi:hypothetical protein